MRYNQGDSFTLRPCGSSDLQRINQILIEAIGTWKLADRVIRLTTPLLVYEPGDFKRMEFTLALDKTGESCGFICWHKPDLRETSSSSALDLHGLYIRPSAQSRGLGQQLMQHAQHYARSIGMRRINLKAWRKAEPYFRTLGYRDLDSTATEKLYPLPLTKTWAT